MSEGGIKQLAAETQIADLSHNLILGLWRIVLWVAGCLVKHLLTMTR